MTENQAIISHYQYPDPVPMNGISFTTASNAPVASTEVGRQDITGKSASTACTLTTTELSSL